MRLAAFIPARGGSKRVPRKNLRRVGGRTLVELAIASARGAGIERVYVSTDDSEIAVEAQQHGAIAIERPAELSADTSSTEEAITHWWRGLSLEERPDAFVLLQPTSPLRTWRHVSEAVSLLVQTGADSAVSVEVSPVHTFAGRVRPREHGAEWKPDRPHDYRPRTQEHRGIGHENGAIWVVRRELWERTGVRQGGDCRAYVMSREDSIDIDSESDLTHANAVLAARASGAPTVEIAGRVIGAGRPAWIVAEVGVNHNGSVDTACELVRAAGAAGCDAVKFQKRTPLLSVPPERRDRLRESCTAEPGELITELQHRERMEIDRDGYLRISAHCAESGLPWFASPWDPPSVAFLEDLGVPAHKIASATVTDLETVAAVASTRKPVVMSTGMSTYREVDTAVDIVQRAGSPLVLLHCVSTYPAENDEVNLRVMEVLRFRYGVPVGYSGHERGIQVSVAAAALGAAVIERHITLDRAMRGSDHGGSLEPKGMALLVRDVRAAEAALGDGEKRVSDREAAQARRLRR